MYSPFIGLSSTVPVASIVLDYGSETVDEEIHDLYLDYFSLPAFVSYVAHVADGNFGGPSARTILQIQNPYTMRAAVRVEFFSGGQPLNLDIEGQMQSSLKLELEPFSCHQIETNGIESPGKTGFARIESNLPVKTQGLFQIWPRQGKEFQESGFQSTTARTHQIIPVEFDREKGVDTAVAIANMGDEDVRVGVWLRQPNGTYPPYAPQYNYYAAAVISARSNLSLFLSELVPYLRSVDVFKGSLAIVSGLGVPVTAVRTMNGVAVSSAPAVSTER